MARRTQEEKAESREKILDAAAKLIREKGIEGTSVSEIMERAGLTHGGFYRHFASKEELVSEAIAVAFRAGLDTFEDGHEGTAQEAAEYVTQYLSTGHVKDLSGACPIPLLSAEIGRGSEKWQGALAEGVEKAAKKLGEGLGHEDRSEALLLLSTLVGTLVLARGVGEGPLQDEVINAASQRLGAMAPAGSITG